MDSGPATNVSRVSWDLKLVKLSAVCTNEWRLFQTVRAQHENRREAMYLNHLESQINRLQQIQNCLARTVVKAPKSSHITSILRSLHWLKINERIEYKLLSLTYKVLTTSQPDYLHNLISVQFTCSCRTCFSSMLPLLDHTVCLCVCLSICLSVCLSVCLSIWTVNCITAGVKLTC